MTTDTNLISFPFRIGTNGSVITRPDDSPDYYAELIALLVLTVPGERDQVPQFGLSDPTFGHLDTQELVSKVAQFGPPVRIVSVKTQTVSDTRQKVVVQFSPLAADVGDAERIFS